MIEKLLIKNYLIIKNAELTFSKGLNILTGETGAGKSIILDALGLLLGERADYGIIKNDNEKLIVEGIFDFSDNKEVKKFIKNKEISFLGEKEGIIIIRRELYKKGISRTFLNDSPISTTDLKELGEIIIDIHSQHEHQSLLKKENHIAIIDSFLDDEKLSYNFTETFYKYKDLVQEINNLINKRKELLERKDYLEYQLKEINNVNPQKEEDTELEKELSLLENSEEISSVIKDCLYILYDGDRNTAADISICIKQLKKIEKYNDEISKMIISLENASENIKELSYLLTDVSLKTGFDPARIEEIRNRLGMLTFLKKKYNLSVDKLIEKANELSSELQQIENIDDDIEKLENIIKEKKKEITQLALKLSTERKKAAKKLSKKVNIYLAETGLEGSDFTVSHDYKKPSENERFNIEVSNNKTANISKDGIDDFEFMIMINKGTGYSPLRKTVSGGEISRIMLSIKAAISEKDRIPILIFDEIDAGISGRIAEKTGNLLKELSLTHQIISITHLPQIAAKSMNHFYVSKKDYGKETTAEIRKLNEEEKEIEIARLLSGEKITEAAVKSAKELIGKKSKT